MSCAPLRGAQSRAEVAAVCGCFDFVSTRATIVLCAVFTFGDDTAQAPSQPRSLKDVAPPPVGATAFLWMVGSRMGVPLRRLSAHARGPFGPPRHGHTCVRVISQ